MKKVLLLLFIGILPVLGFAQYDLVKWNLTTNENVSTAQSYVTASSVTYVGSSPSYSADGLSLANFNNASLAHYRFFQITIKPTSGNALNLSKLAFEQAQLNGGPSQYGIKYYISNNGTVPEDSIFFTTYSTWLINDESISGNPVKNISLDLPTLTSSQTLIIRFYARGAADYNAFGWRIKANTLKITGSNPNDTSATPVAVSDTFTTVKNVYSSFNVLANDSYGNLASSLSITQQPANGSAVINSSNQVVFTPTANYVGTTNFKYTITNINGTSNEATVTVEVKEPVLEPLVVWNNTDRTATTPSNNAIGANMVANDGITISNVANNNTSQWFQTGNWPTPQYNQTPYETLNQSKYIEYSITAKSGTSIALSEFKFNYHAQGTPQSFEVRYSTDDFATSTVLQQNQVISNSSWNQFSKSLSNVAPLLAGSTLKIRVYAYNTNNNFNIKRIKDLTTPNDFSETAMITGTVSAAAAPCTASTAPTGITGNSTICSGTNVNLQATGGSEGTNNVYEWGTGTVGSNIIAGQTTATLSHVPTVTTTYWVRRVNCSTNTAAVTKTVTLGFGNPATSTTDFWTGYVYTYTETPAATNYIGYVEEDETFDRTNNTAISGRGANNGRNNLCATPSDYFLVRYKMSKTFTPGTYTFTVGGDDGYRLSLDNGANWVVADYTDHGYSAKTVTVCLTGTEPKLLLLEYYERAGASRVSFSYAAGGSATAPTQIAGNSTSCSGGSLTLTASGGAGSIYQWGTGTVGSNIIPNQSGSTITVTFNSTTTYWVRRVVGACNEATYTNAVSKTVTLSVPTGDPSLFGISTWNVYAFSGQNMSPPLTSFLGYYTQNTLGPDTQDTANNGWNGSTSPSSSAGWNGCSVPVDQFTFIHKRKGFPSGSYLLTVRNYDDATRILINGVQVRNYTSWYGGGTTYTDELGLYCLDANTTIEVITLEAGGEANFKMDIQAVNATYAGGAWNDNSDPSNKSVEIQNHLTVNNNLTVCSCTVKTGTTLTISANNTLTVIGDVIVEGTGKIIVENNGSFIQRRDDATFTGATNSFEMKRNTQPVFKYDYTYWSSPVKADAGFTLKMLSPTTTPTRYMKWNHTATPQAWQVLLNGPEVMAPGRGYIVRAPAGYNVEGAGAAQIYNANFIGHPNNGAITHDVTGSTSAKAFNLLGNPYPGALDAAKFLAENSQTLGGTLYFWTHNTAFSNATNFSYTPSDYATWNGTGSTATSEGDASYNNLSKPTGYIAAGQAFFVQGIGSGAGTAVFNNTMRVVGQNNQFFKPAPVQPIENWQTTGKHRVWLNLTSTQNDFNQALVGYIENATNQLDNNFDGEVFSGGAVSLYSIAESKKLTIQGRALPFSNQDEVPLGFKTTLTGTLKISIDEVDGLLTGQNIYLKDNVLDVVHNLKDSDYTFTTVPGTFDNRFVLRYLPQEDLSTDEPIIDANSVVVFNNSNQISIKSTAQIISKVEIFDLQGRVIFTKNNIDAQAFATQTLSVSNQMLIVKVTTDNNAVLVKKVMLK